MAEVTVDPKRLIILFARLSTPRGGGQKYADRLNTNGTSQFHTIANLYNV